eukprot:m.76698 g.76698  ORF g.76698 m.76698 type:complete len:407 (-) comp17244_c0_seq2:92-1312(-)
MQRRTACPQTQAGLGTRKSRHQKRRNAAALLHAGALCRVTCCARDSRESNHPIEEILLRAARTPGSAQTSRVALHNRLNGSFLSTALNLLAMAAWRRLATRAFATAPRAVPQKVVVTASLNGVLTDPKKFNVPVTPDEMAKAAKEAYDAGASVVHIHFRNQQRGHEPTWDPQVAKDICDAIRASSPVLINLTTGTFGKKFGNLSGGPLGPTGGPIACLDACKPFMAALNSGSLNYLRSTSKGTWAWQPVLFDNPVSKVETMLKAMQERNIIPECECFDTGIVRSIAMYEQVGLMKQPIHVSLVMGVASGMAAKPAWLPLLIDELSPGTQFQVIAIGREEVWPLLRECARLGGNVRTGLEDTFYKPDGTRATSSGQLIEELVKIVREEGREPASVDETKLILSKGHQ